MLTNTIIADNNACSKVTCFVCDGQGGWTYEADTGALGIVAPMGNEDCQACDGRGFWFVEGVTYG